MNQSRFDSPRPILSSLALMIATVVAGLIIRFAKLGLPPVVSKYGGSMLWALTIYWILSTCFPRLRLAVVALFAGTVASAVEFLKLFHSPGLDAFRFTLPGILLLGRFFSVWDIVAYWAAILVGAVLDQSVRRKLV